MTRDNRPLPDGYPLAWESSVRLADGRRVDIRPVVPGDADELAEAIRAADAETLHLRFLGSAPPVTPELVRRLTTVDYRNRFALVARHGGRGVAIARYEALPPAAEPPASAEIAVAVRPEWRGVGLATVLVQLLARRAQQCGIGHFHALYSAANRPVAELARWGQARVVIEAGAAELDAALGSVAAPATDPRTRTEQS